MRRETENRKDGLSGGLILSVIFVALVVLLVVLRWAS